MLTSLLIWECKSKPKWDNNKNVLRQQKFKRLTISRMSKNVKQLDFSYAVDENIK